MPKCYLCNKERLKIPCFYCYYFYCFEHVAAHQEFCAQVLQAVHGLSGNELEAFRELAFISEQYYRFRQIHELFDALAAVRDFVQHHFRHQRYILEYLDILLAKCVSLLPNEPFPRNAGTAEEMTYYKHFHAILRTQAAVCSGKTHYYRLAQLNSANYLISRGDATGARRLCEMEPFAENVAELYRIFTVLQVTYQLKNAAFINDKTADAIIRFRLDEYVAFCYFYLAYVKYFQALRASPGANKYLFSRIHYAYCQLHEVMHKAACNTSGAHLMLAFIAMSWLFCKVLVDVYQTKKVAFRALRVSTNIQQIAVEESTLRVYSLTRERPVCMIYNEFTNSFWLLTRVEDCFAQLGIASKLKDLESYFEHCLESEESMNTTASFLRSYASKEADQLLAECKEADLMLRLAMGQRVEQADDLEI